MTIAAAIADFIAAHAAAWSSGDIDTVGDAMGLPQMLAGAGGTTFIEDDRQLVEWVEDRLARWRDHGVTAVTATVEAIEELPDEAARVTSRWQLTGSGDPVSFIAVDTIASDDGEWYYVVTDIAGEEVAWANPGSPGSGRN